MPIRWKLKYAQKRPQEDSTTLNQSQPHAEHTTRDADLSNACSFRPSLWLRIANSSEPAVAALCPNLGLWRYSPASLGGLLVTPRFISTIEVMPIDIRDQSRMYRSPSQEFLGRYTRPREVTCRHSAEKSAEVVACLFRGNADQRQVQVPTNDPGDVAEWHPLVANAIKPRPSRGGFQCQAVQGRRIEAMDSRPAIGPVADVGRDALLAGNGDQSRHEAVMVALAMYGQRERDNR